MTETHTNYSVGNQPIEPTHTARWHLTVNGLTVYHMTLAALLFDLHERLEVQMRGETVVYRIKKK